MKNITRIRILCLLLCTLAALACVPTPTEEAVMQKNTEQLVELALSDEPEQQLSEMALSIEQGEQGNADAAPPVLHITKDCEIKRSDLHVTIDADVILPNANRIPMAHIQKGAFPEDFLRRVSHYLGNDCRPIEVFPKSYYQDIANHLIERRDSGDLDKYDSVDEINRAIIDVLNDADAAPDEPVYSDRDPVTQNDHIHAETGWWCSDYCGVSSIGTIYSMQFEARGVSYFRNVNDLIPFENAYNFRNPLCSAQPMVDKGRIRMTLPERSIDSAQQEAVQLIDDLGLSGDFTLVRARIAPLFEYAQEAQENGCEAVYEFLFTRQVNGVNVTYTNDLQNEGRYEDDPMGGYAMQWRYERVRVYVDDLGILAFYYDGQPYEVTEITSPAVKTISVNDAIDRFEKMLSLKYADDLNRSDKTDKRMHVTEIRLGLSRVLEQNAPGQAYLVPSWTFFGTKLLRDNPYVPGWEGEGYDGTTALMVVNAIDGSIIDPLVGY